MGLRCFAIALIAVVCCAVDPVAAQSSIPSEKLTLSGTVAATWTQGHGNVVLLRGPVKIEFDRASLSADSAVVWLNPASQDNFDIQTVQIALIGHAALQQNESTRTGGQLFVEAEVRGGGIRIVADERVARDDSATPLYQQAVALRRVQPPASLPATTGPASAEPGESPVPPGRHPTTRATPANFQAPIDFEAANLQTITGEDGYITIVLSEGVRLMERRPNNEIIELSADNAVVFTSLRSMKELQQSGGKKRGREMILAAYLEGDVRIDYVPTRPKAQEQRMTANRVYYDFATDRAVLTDAIIHTIEPARGLPVVMRAKLVRQLAAGEYEAEGVKLSTSTFAVPSYCLAADKLYLRSEPTGDPRIGDQILYTATNTKFEAFDVPFFFLPQTSGEISRGTALRGIGFGNSHDFGFFLESVWGLFETFNQTPPRDLDANYRVDYFSKRGPGFGLNASYGGGFVTDTDKQPWDFEGLFKSYLVYDHGADDLGFARAPERVNEPDMLRGQVLWEHQHYFPDNWQLQARLGYVSDPTFMEQWFREDFQDGSPHNFVGYVKHQVDNEAFTFGAVYQPNRFVTNSEFVQEQFEVDRLPQIGYHNEGAGLLGDNVTLFSENDFEGLHFARSHYSITQQGFIPAANITPGLPAEGYTGLNNQVVWRGDVRQELDMPFTAGPLRIAPFIMGRFTPYSDSPVDNQPARGLVGAGTRITTEFWKVDPTAQSDLLDIHQIRHVIEPEINLFTSAMNVQRQQVLVYDQQVDAINDITAAEFAVHQRWQTKRGGPGEWRSVDAFTVNVAVDVFENKPPKRFNNPYDFRGLYFSTYPEESVPRDAVNIDASWRLSDNTVILGDASQNLDRGNLQTLSAGILVRRDQRLSYFIGNRYIADLNSNITSVNVNYQITPKYTLAVDQEFDFTQGRDVYSSLAIVRTFDTFIMAVRYYHDETTNESSFSFNVNPIGLGYGFDSTQASTFRR